MSELLHEKLNLMGYNIESENDWAIEISKGNRFGFYNKELQTLYDDFDELVMLDNFIKGILHERNTGIRATIGHKVFLRGMKNPLNINGQDLFYIRMSPLDRMAPLEDTPLIIVKDIQTKDLYVVNKDAKILKIAENTDVDFRLNPVGKDQYGVFKSVFSAKSFSLSRQRVLVIDKDFNILKFDT